MKKINIAVVGLGFGGAFVKIYRNHPNVGAVGICDANKKVVENTAAELGITKIYADLGEILRDRDIDAVHLVTPILLHEEQASATLEAGKHCACTVPMATTLGGIQRVTEAARRSGKNYMMMETTLYTYQFFYVHEMLINGALGRIQFMRGSHYQDMTGWPDYWRGFPPMHYSTHAIAPMAALSGSRVSRVCCFGSGTMDPELRKKYDNPYPVECALLEFENGLKAEATRSLFETARQYQEGLFVYGSEASFEWGFRDDDEPYVTRFSNENGGRGRRMVTERIAPPNRAGLLPGAIRSFTAGDGQFDPLNPQLALSKGKGGGHHGSHPHLVHEFVMSVIEGRKPRIDEISGGNITAAGICAHESALKNGAMVEVPVF